MITSPPASVIFSCASFEQVGTVTFKALVILPVPKSLVYPRLVKSMVFLPFSGVGASSVSFWRLSVLSIL